MESASFGRLLSEPCKNTILSTMYNSPPHPWNFSPIDKAFVSPNGRYKVEYRNLGEIAMSAPFGGDCAILWEDHRLDLGEHCAGPIVWNAESTQLALPIWTRKRMQQIAVVDMKTFLLRIYAETFRVLNLQSFHSGLIKGIDSPIYKPGSIVFDLLKEEIVRVKKLSQQ